MKNVGGNGDYRLRRASRTDAPAVEALFSELLRSLDEASAGDYESGYLDRFFTGGEDWICLAESAAGVVGYLSVELHREARPFLYLDDFCVTEAWRNRGIGSALLAAAETYAREKGVDLMLLSGPLCAHTAEGFGENALLYPDKASLMAAIPSQLRQGDTVLVKASLGSKYAEISDFLGNYHPD